MLSKHNQYVVAEQVTVGERLTQQQIYIFKEDFF